LAARTKAEENSPMPKIQEKNKHQTSGSWPMMTQSKAAAGISSSNNNKHNSRKPEREWSNTKKSKEE